MQQLKVIVDYCNDLLRINEFKDYCPNGLQIEGRSEINKIICGVTACQALIDSAIEKQADAILVHHGYFWKNEDPVITGIKRKRVQSLLEHGVSLLAYHLPLDAHKLLGNNATLAQKLSLQVDKDMQQAGEQGLLWNGQLNEQMSANDLVSYIEARLGRAPLHLPDAANKSIKKIAWCTGGAQHYIEEAAAMGMDAYISGEVSEQTFHLARELNIHYFAAGHHATESYGVQALAAHLSDQFAVQTEFVDITNPV